MSVLPSLIAALERAAGDCLVLRSGERPHVVAGEARHDVGNTVLSAKAVEALAAQILSPEGQKELSERSSVQEVLSVDVPEGSLTARAERAGDEIYVELRRHRRAPKPAAVEPPPAVAQPEPAPAEAIAVAAPEAPNAETPAPVAIAEPAPVPVAAAEPVAAEPVSPAPPVETASPLPVSEAVAAPTEVEAPQAEAAAPPQTEEPHQPPAPPQLIVERFEPQRGGVTVVAAPTLEEPPQAAAPAIEPEPPAEQVEAPPAPPVMHAPAVVHAPAPVPAPVRRATAVVPSSSRDLTDDLDELIADAAERGATALYLREGQQPAARIEERLQPLDDTVVSAARMTEIVASCTSGRDGWRAGDHGTWQREFDLAGLVTCYPFSDHAGNGVVIRLTPRNAASGVQRHVPRQIRRSCESEDGLLLVTAPTQADLLAVVGAVGDLAARKRAGYVICLEPTDGLPHPVAGAFVSERRLTGTRDDMRATIARAVQEAPDILVVAAAEPPVGIEEVILSAGASGRLVVLGVVASTVLGAVESVLANVEREREPQVRKAFAGALRAAFGYHGLRRIGGGRTAVQDVLVGTNEVRTRLERADFGGIEQVQRQGRDGMRTLDAALARAVGRRQVTLRHAAAYAVNRSELVALARRDARERRAIEREQRSGERRQGVLRAI